MKDHETLSTHNVKDGLTVHLVIKAPRTPSNQSQDSSLSQRLQGIKICYLGHHFNSTLLSYNNSIASSFTII